MKKIIVAFVIMFLNLIPVEAKSSILIEANSRQILKCENEIKRHYPASTTKIMTMILIFEEIQQGNLKYNDQLTCSLYASSMGGSQVYLEEGEQMSVEELLRCIAIASANDACVMIAEHIAGSHEAFVEMMNLKAKQLKLENTHFENATGLHHSNHYTCAKDLATMASYLLKVGGKKLLSITSMYDSYVREGSQKFWLVNTNKLLKQYKGVDGLKTGYTKEAGYCLVTSCLRNDIRLIGVVMNEEKPQTRNQKMIDLLGYGYSNYTLKKLYRSGDVVSTLDVHDLYKDTVNIICREDVTYLQHKRDDKLESQIVYQIRYPIQTDKPIAYLVLKNEQTSTKYPLYSNKEVKKSTIPQKYIRIFCELI